MIIGEKRLAMIFLSFFSGTSSSTVPPLPEGKSFLLFIRFGAFRQTVGSRFHSPQFGMLYIMIQAWLLFLISLASGAPLSPALSLPTVISSSKISMYGALSFKPDGYRCSTQKQGQMATTKRKRQIAAQGTGIPSVDKIFFARGGMKQMDGGKEEQGTR